MNPFSSRRQRCVLQRGGDKCVWRLEPPTAQLGRNDRLYRLELFGRIHTQIDFRGADVGMPEPQRDLSDVMSGLQQDHGATVG